VEKKQQVILVDTNAWVHHLRKADTKLVAFLRQQRVRTCDVVIGELALGSGLPKTFARDLAALPKLPSPTALETRMFIERHSRSYAGAGVGWADAQIILAAAKTGARLYTSDRSVRRVCAAVDVPLA
jgi:predicted nucleic acid-binding protein